MTTQKGMKKFFSTLSLTSPSAHKPELYVFDNSCSEMKNNLNAAPHRNPIIPFIRHNAEPGETIKLYIIACIGDSTDGRMILSDNKDWDSQELINRHKERYIEEVEAAKTDIGFNYELEVIYVKGIKNDDHLKLVQDIVSRVEDNDIIFMDITYGLRTIIISQFLSLTYCYKVRQGVSIGSLSYGQKYGSVRSRIYNLNAFFLFNQTINNLGDLPSPELFIDSILGNLITGDEENE